MRQAEIMQQQEDISIAKLFAGADVFVTGGSGFMGKVLLEKLLRSCPDIGRIFVLLRPKKGKSVQERLEIMTDVKLFEPLRGEDPNAFRKLISIEGDCAEIGFGMSATDTATLIETVSIFFHSAASVRFDDPIKKAVLLNTRGTREALELAKKMKKLLVFQYVSTTYCYPNEKVIKEKVYPILHDWRNIISMAERDDDNKVMDTLTHKLLEYQPNTYTFSKALAEQAVQDYRNELPVVIFRPAVVINSFMEPFSGWVDNFNGPFAMWVAVAKGVVRYLYADQDTALSYTPVDWAIRGMIQVAWARARGIRVSEDKEEVDVVNMESNNYDRKSHRDSLLVISENLDVISNGVRYPRVTFTTCYYYYWLGFMISQVHYSFAIDCLLRLYGQKPRLMRLTRKIFGVCEATYQFMFNEYHMETKNIEKIDEAMVTDDREKFSSLEFVKLPKEDYYNQTLVGSFEYLLKEPYSPKETMKHINRLWILEKVHYAVWILGLMWILHKMIF